MVFSSLPVQRVGLSVSGWAAIEARCRAWDAARTFFFGATGGFARCAFGEALRVVGFFGGEAPKGQLR